MATRTILAAALCATLTGCADNPGSASFDGASGDSTRDVGTPDRLPGDLAKLGDLFPAPVPDDCLTNVGAGQHTAQCEGITVDITVPDACVLAACGLIADIPGAGMHGSDQDALTNLRSLAKQHGYIIVQPTAPSVDLKFQPQHDDAVFKVIQRVAHAWHVDSARVHMTGFSLGGWMTWRFLCAHSDVIASVAPAANAIASCGAVKPAKQIDVLFLFGTKDPIVPLKDAIAVRDGIASGWGMGAPQVVDSDTDYTHNRFSNPQGTTLETFEHDYVTDPNGPLSINAGHCIPGGSTLSAGCQPPNAFAWGAELVKFFKAHPQRP